MPEYLVELYISRSNGGAVAEGAESARRAAEELGREGVRIRYVQSIFVPEEETCFFLYEAASVEAVREAARRAALPFEHVTEAVTQAKGVEQ
ncbi:MAG TPA: nickel-binding protein [Gaiellaceae bacterium]|nr:nickel-binding protein [Gaiellaceae bacterium]